MTDRDYEFYMKQDKEELIDMIETAEGNVETYEMLVKELRERIYKAIEYICNVLCNDKAQVRNDISGEEIDKLLEILGGTNENN